MSLLPRKGRVPSAGLLATVLLAACLAACGAEETPSQSEPLRIGIAAQLTGSAALIGQQSVEGARLAADEINSLGGILGRQVVIVPADEASDPAVGINAINKLVFDDKVDVVLGPDTSSVTLATMNITRDEEKLQLTSSLNPTITEQGDEWIFRLRPTDRIAADLIAQYVVDELGLKRIAVLNSRDDYGQGGADAFVSALKTRYGLAPVDTITANTGDTNFVPLLQRVSVAKADGLLLWWSSITEVAKILQQRNDVGLKIPIFGSNAMVNSTVVDLATPQLAAGAISATNYANSNPHPKTVEFESKFKAATGKTPNDHASLYYDAVYLLRAAAEQGKGSSSTQLRDGLRAVKDFCGITSKFSFDAKGEPGNSMLIVRNKAEGGQEVLKAFNYCQ
jgi:branched-chain amino acid transport system substrate-binding protein